MRCAIWIHINDSFNGSLPTPTGDGVDEGRTHPFRVLLVSTVAVVSSGIGIGIFILPRSSGRWALPSYASYSTYEAAMMMGNTASNKQSTSHN